MNSAADLDVDLYRAVAADAALLSGRIQKERLGTDIGIRHKGELDLVTEVDQACERAIVARLRASFPHHDLVAEESAPSLTGADYVWYVDPLDGTTNYAHGYPFFCTSIALVRRGEVMASAVYDPVKDELFTAARGRGATCNGRPLRVSASTDLAHSVFMTASPTICATTFRTRSVSSSASFITRALCDATAPPPSISRTSRPAASTATSRNASSPGTSSPAPCSSRNRAVGCRGSMARRSAFPRTKS
jgi:fructose-1,6-bisphosphatase/inositol monophosphatase family enzyme